MDGTRFDRLTRAFARVGTRRQVVAGVAVVAVGAGGLEAADAATRCRAGRQTCQRDGQCCSGACRRGKDVPLKDRNRCACGESETPCGNICADLQQDERNCGACGMRCRTGDLCCPDGCIDAKTDEANCGACGNACGDGEACCGGSCAALDSDADNCGGCGRACAEGGACISGACAEGVALCFAKWPEETNLCVVSSGGKTYNQGHFIVSGDDDDERSFCTSSTDCQDAAICSLSGVTCVCVTDVVWGPNPEDSSHYDPNICHAVVPTSGCTAGAAGLAPFTRCNETVEGELWGTYEQDSEYGSECLSSDECNGDWDSLCDDPDYGCRCVFAYSSVPAVSVSFSSKTRCWRHRVRLPA